MNTKEKTNIEHLHSLLTKGQEEKLEFLEAIKAEMAAKDETIATLTKRVLELEDEYGCENAPDEDEFTDEINTGIGVIDYRIETGNLQLTSLMEVFEEKIKKHTPRKIEQVLEAL